MNFKEDNNTFTQQKLVQAVKEQIPPSYKELSSILEDHLNQVFAKYELHVEKKEIKQDSVSHLYEFNDSNLYFFRENVVKAMTEYIPEEDKTLKSILSMTVIEAFEDYEEQIEDEAISKQYANRLDLPDDQWITVPEGMSLLEFFKLRQKDENEKK